MKRLLPLIFSLLSTVALANDSTYVFPILRGDTASIYAFDDPNRDHGKHPWMAALEATSVNVFVHCFDRFILAEDFAKSTPKSIWHNVKNGFVWDNDQFSTNLFAHPYHGGLYFNSARSNGLNFWESAPYAFGGSLMWELAGEVEPPAINDLIATTFGGICIGEVTYRVSDLVYDDRTQGFPRFLRELAGAVLSPIKALNRIISGDAWRIRHSHYKYHDYDKLPISFSIATGIRYLADDNAMFRGENNPYVNFDLQYGKPFDSDNNAPYDYFTADVSFGLNSNQPLVSHIHLLGRLWSAPLIEGDNMSALFGFFQHFNYYDSQPVKDGTHLVPYRISEAAAIGPGVLYQFPEIGNLTKLEQHIYLDAILLGGSLSDYYNVIDRDYNMGSGFSAKVNTLMEFGKFGKFSLISEYYRIFTWKGYEDKDLSTINPLYLNAQGDKGNASLFVLSPNIQLSLNDHLSLELDFTQYWRYTYYKYHKNVSSNTFETKLGLRYEF